MRVPSIYDCFHNYLIFWLIRRFSGINFLTLFSGVGLSGGYDFGPENAGGQNCNCVTVNVICVETAFFLNKAGMSNAR